MEGAHGPLRIQLIALLIELFFEAHLLGLLLGILIRRLKHVAVVAH